MAPGHSGFHLGRRGVCLLFFGLVDLVYSFSLINPDKVSRANPFLASIAAIAPLWLWSLFWGITGLLCIFYAFRTRYRVGFTAAVFLKVTWAVTCLAVWLMGGAERGYVAAAIWLAFAGFVWVLSGWPEAPPTREEAETWRRPSG